MTIRTNPAEPDKPGRGWIEAATTSRRLFVCNATTACPLTLAERVAWSFLLLPLAEDRGATRARIMHGTGLGEQAVATAVAGLVGNGLAKVIDHQIKAVRPEGAALDWFRPRRKTEELPWYERYSYWVLHLRGPECPLSYDHAACLWLLLDLDHGGRNRGQSFAGIGQMLGVSYKTVQRAIAQFSKHDYLTVRHRGLGAARRFDFTFHEPPAGFSTWWDRPLDGAPDDELPGEEPEPKTDEPADIEKPRKGQLTALEVCLNLLANHGIPTRGRKLGELPAMVERFLVGATQSAGIAGFTSILTDAQQQHDISGTAPHCGFLVHSMLQQKLDQQARRDRAHDEAMAELDRRIERFTRLIAPVVEEFGPRRPSTCPDCQRSYRDLLRVPPHYSPAATAATLRMRALLADQNPTVNDSIRVVECECGQRVVGQVSVGIHLKGNGEWWFPAIPGEEPKPEVVALPKEPVGVDPVTLERQGLVQAPCCPACDRTAFPLIEPLKQNQWPDEVVAVRDRIEEDRVVQELIVGSTSRCPLCRSDWPGLILRVEFLDGDRWVTGYRAFTDAAPC